MFVARVDLFSSYSKVYDFFKNQPGRYSGDPWGNDVENPTFESHGFPRKMILEMLGNTTSMLA